MPSNAMKDRKTVLAEFPDPLKALDYFGLLCAEGALNQMYNDLSKAGLLSPKIEEVITIKRNSIAEKIKNFK